MGFSRRTIFFFFVLANCYSFGQGVTIQGTILDDSTKLPVDYAQIYINDPTNSYWVSTVSNLEGSFTILFPDKYLSDTLRVSLVGFESTKLPISAINNSNGTLGLLA